MLSSNLFRLDEDEARLIGPNTAQQVKCLPSKTVPLPHIEGTVFTVISDLLNALAIKNNYKSDDGTSPEVSCLGSTL